ncbi:MAG: DUF3489 domain-containing protein [Pseudomonadota bacterium]
MINLNDTQLVLLSAASRRESGNLIPLPDTLADKGDDARKAISSLIKAKFVEEGAVATANLSWRTDDDIMYGVRITATGLTAIGASEDSGDAQVEQPVEPAGTPPKVTKAGLVLDLLRREVGATLDEIIEVTGWLPHTTRAALTGIRKKGHAIDKSKRGETTCYRIAA